MGASTTDRNGGRLLADEPVLWGPAVNALVIAATFICSWALVIGAALFIDRIVF